MLSNKRDTSIILKYDTHIKYLSKKQKGEIILTMYETVIGLEVHVELATKTKIFCGCTTEFGKKANTQCCPICIGMPGTLPALNKKVVEYAIAVGVATNCQITKTTKFERKNYFYPDLPKAYQISQLRSPICTNGHIDIEVNGIIKTIGIHEIHMEEDAGKLIHDLHENKSYIDYNRGGVPLLEIVSEPHMNNAEEVIAYLEKLKLILEYLGVSDCKMQEGSFRVDINLSVRKKGVQKLGTRTEMKNMNSFKAIGRAIESEKKRQIQCLEEGKTIVQETRRWDDNKNISFSMRSKEDAKDYRYFPEPDLLPIKISEEWIQTIKQNQPELRSEKINRYVEQYGIPLYDATVLTNSKKLADLFEQTCNLCREPKEASNWLMVEAMRLLKKYEMEAEDITLSPKNLATLIRLIKEGRINRTVGKDVFEIIFKEDTDTEAYVISKGLITIRNDEELKQAAKEIFAEYPTSIEDYKNGKEKAFGFLMGQTMKKTKGKADPSILKQILKELLEES